MEKIIGNNLTIEEKTRKNSHFSDQGTENDIDSTNEEKKGSTDTESLYTQHLVPFSIKLKLLKKAKLSEILKKDLSSGPDNNTLDDSNSIPSPKFKIEKDENLVHFKVRYESEEDSKFTWDLFKTYKEIKELLLKILTCVQRKSISEKNTTALVFKNLPLIAKLNYEEYSNCTTQIIDLLNSLLKYRKIRDQLFFLEFLEISRHSFDCFNEGIKPKEGYIKKRTGSRSHSCLFNCLCGFLINCCCNKFQVRWFVLKDDMICYLDSSSDNIGKDVFWFDQELILKRDFDGKNTLGLINGTRTLILKFSQNYEREIWYDLILTKIKLYQSSVKNIYDSFANEKNFCNARWFVDANSYFEDLHTKLMSAKESIYIAGWWVSPEIFLKRPINLKAAEESSAANPVRLMDVLKQKAEEGVLINLLIFKEVKLALSLDSNHSKNVFNKLHKNIRVTRHPKKNLDLLWSHHEKIVIIDQRVGYVGGIDLCWGRYDTPEHKIHEAHNEHEIYHWPGIDYCNSRVNDFNNLSEYHLESVDRHSCARMPWHDISVCLEGPVVSDICRHFVERWNFARTDYRFVQNKKHTIVNVKKPRTYSRNSKSGFKRHATVNLNSSSNSENSSGLRTPLLEENDMPKRNRERGSRSSFLDIFSKPPIKYSNYNIYQDGGYHSDNNRKSFNKRKQSNLDCFEIKESNESYENSLFDKSGEHSLGSSHIILSNNKQNSSNNFCNLKSSDDFNKAKNRDPDLYTINEKNDYSEFKPRYTCDARNNLSSEIKKDVRTSNINRRSTYNNIKSKSKEPEDRKYSNKLVEETDGRSSILNRIKTRFNNFTDKIKSNVKDKIMNSTLFKKNFGEILNDEDLINIKINDGEIDLTENRTCQILRSAAEWSVGLDRKTENSILKAYYDLIDNSKHYIFIENQFFVSKSFTHDESILGGVKSSSIINEIALHLRRRIERAYEEKQKFRVFIFIPLLPAFPGEVMDTCTLQIILKYTYRTISRNRGLSLIEKLYQLMQEGYEDYIYFFSLRTHGVINGIPSTELIYIHSKTMIVDDQVALIGSANINDRSMLGSRDSEVAVLIKDSEKINSKMNGENYMASSFARSLRLRLLKEHLGISENECPEMLLDPLDDRLFQAMKQIAKSNTLLYREIFNVYPDDKFEKFSDIPTKKEDGVELLQKYHSNKDKIIGNIVEFPLNFLKEENLNRSYFSKEIIVPIKNFL